MYLLETVTPMVDVPPYVRGMGKFRENIITLYDIRVLFGMPTYEQELDAFVEDRKKDLMNWVNELERCATTGQAFTLATDPAQCRFGKQINSFRTENSSLRGCLSKIDAPHKQLHDAAETVITLASLNKTDDALAAVTEIRQTYYHAIISFLSEMAGVYHNTKREMVIAVNLGKATFGIIVDSVLGVEKLREIIPIPNVATSEYVSHIGLKEKDGSTVLMLNCSTL